ncbi:MAG: hypothetical protein R3C28_00585 [Pirellulaceae bacterium]
MLQLRVRVGRIAILLVTMLDAPCSAIPTAEIALPSGRVSKSGVVVTVRSSWINTSGYRPLDITIDCPKGATADRSFVVVMEPTGWYYNNHKVAVRTELELPQGSTSVQRRVYVPQNYSWNSLTVDTYEDGVQDKELSASSGFDNSNYNGQNWTEAYPGWLFIDSDALSSNNGNGKLPDFRSCLTLIPPSEQIITQMAQGLYQADSEFTVVDRRNFIRSLSTAHLAAPSNIPDHWLGYTCIGITVISTDDLQVLQTDYPQRWDALQTALKTGGVLVVYDEAEADSQPVADTVRKAFTNDTLGNWRDPSSVYGHAIPRNVIPSDYNNNFLQRTGIDSIRHRPEEEDRFYTDEDGNSIVPKAPAASFVTASYVGGHVVAVQGDPFSEPPYYWDWILREVGPDNWQWHRRNGFSTVRNNVRFWDWMIPGVGAAPVGAFVILITLFVIVIGPVNYFWLQHWKRLYLILFTVPLGAGLVTIALLTYSILHDGLGTRIRIRSFTSLTADNEMTAWSRQTYYAGLAPSGGMTFDQNTAVFVVDPDPYDAPKEREVDWVDSQRLGNGYLRSRVLSQFATMTTKTQSPEFSIQAIQEDGQIRVTNHSQVMLEHVICKGLDGKTYYGEAIPPNGTGVLLDNVAADVLMVGLLQKNRPAAPEGFRGGGGRWSRRRYYGNYSMDEGTAMPSFETSVMERQINRIANLANEPNGVFFAITDETPASIDVGVEGGQHEAGFHVIHGLVQPLEAAEKN